MSDENKMIKQSPQEIAHNNQITAGTFVIGIMGMISSAVLFDAGGHGSLAIVLGSLGALFFIASINLAKNSEWVGK